jgi:hypothetical protein
METLPMKFILLFCLAGVAALNGQTSTTKPKTPPARTSVPEVKIPADAVKTEDGSYKYTDSKGKKWIYRNTPFGVAKSEDKPIDATATPFGKAKLQEKPAEAPKPVVDTNPTRAFEDGDSYRFERNTPFGVSKWTKKKTDLDASEKQIVANQANQKNKQ